MAYTGDGDIDTAVLLLLGEVGARVSSGDDAATISPDAAALGGLADVVAAASCTSSSRSEIHARCSASGMLLDSNSQHLGVASTSATTVLVGDVASTADVADEAMDGEDAARNASPRDFISFNFPSICLWRAKMGIIALLKAANAFPVRELLTSRLEPKDDEIVVDEDDSPDRLLPPSSTSSPFNSRSPKAKEMGGAPLRPWRDTCPRTWY